MKNHIIFVLLLFFATFSSAKANELVGIFTTEPTVFPGFQKPYTDKVKEGIKAFTWKMEVTSTEIKIWTRPGAEPEVMPYEKQGKYLLAREEDTEVTKYTPFYIENNDTIHGFLTIFFRVKK